MADTGPHADSAINMLIIAVLAADLLGFQDHMPSTLPGQQRRLPCPFGSSKCTV